MTMLSMIQQAAQRIGIVSPNAVVSSSDRKSCNC